MEKSYYVHTPKINARIADTVIPGCHIVIDNLTYQKVSRRPAGKVAFRKMVSIDEREKLILFK